MIFKDRQDAALKLYEKLKDSPHLKPRKDIVVVSLLRGGAVLGAFLAKKLRAKHLPLAVVKVGAPDNEELAIGALVFDVVYLERKVIDSLLLLKPRIRDQISLARQRFENYCKKFSLREDRFKNLKGKTLVLVDDGIATGASMRAAVLFVRERGVAKVIICSPISAEDFRIPGVNESIILHTDPYFKSVSQFYAEFPQISDSEVKKLLKP